MSKIALTTGLLLLCLVFFAHAEPLSPVDLKNLLARIRQKQAAAPQRQADFHQEKNIHLLSKPISNPGKLWFQPPNKFRVELKGNSPSITVSDGQQVWIYYPKFQSAEHYSLGKRSPLDAAIATITAGMNLENLENTYRISATRLEKGYELTLTPRTTSMKKFLQKFTVRINDELQLERTEMLQPNGDRIITTYTNETRAAIDPSTFEFAPPPSTNVTTPLGR